MTPPVRACIGLGANLGDRQANIDAALALLRDTEGVSLLASATPVQTAPVTADPAESQPDYLNSAAVIETTLAPRELLDALLSIERALGRDRANEKRWGPRLIDLDLLLYGDRVIDEPGLTVPHPEMHKRAFVLTPLAEIAPDAHHPVLCAAIRDLLNAVSPDPPRVPLLRCLALAAIGAVICASQARAQPLPDDAQSQATQFLEELGDASRNLTSVQWIEIAPRSDDEEPVRALYDPRRGFLTPTVGVAWDDARYALWNPQSSARVLWSEAPPGQERAAAIRSLRAFPIPQLRFAINDDALTGVFGDIRWTGFEQTEEATSLTGEIDGYTIAIEDLDAAPPLDELRISPTEPSSEGAVVIRSGVADESFSVEHLSHRRPVQTMAKLTPARGALTTGDPLARLVLLDSQSVPWFGPVAAQMPHTLLLILRESDPWSSQVDSVLRELMEEPALAEVEVRPVTVLANGDGDLAARIARRIDKWGGNLLWTVSSQSSIDLFAPDATAVAVLLDDAGVILDLAVIENRASDTESLARQFVDALPQ